MKKLKSFVLTSILRISRNKNYLRIFDGSLALVCVVLLSIPGRLADTRKKLLPSFPWISYPNHKFYSFT